MAGFASSRNGSTLHSIGRFRPAAQAQQLLAVVRLLNGSQSHYQLHEIAISQFTIGFPLHRSWIGATGSSQDEKNAIQIR